MPYQPSPGGGTFNPEAPVGVLTIVDTGPLSASNSTALSVQPRSLAEAAEEAQVQVKALPQVIRSVADLPTNARPGTFFTSRLNPTAIYILCEDNVWRGLTLLPVT